MGWAGVAVPDQIMISMIGCSHRYPERIGVGVGLGVDLTWHYVHVDAKNIIAVRISSFYVANR